VDQKYESKHLIEDRSKLVYFKSSLNSEVSKMKNKKRSYKIVAPKIPKELDEFYFSNDYIENEDTFCMSIVAHCSIEYQTAQQVSFKQMIFRNVTFKEVSFEGVDITDVRFENCDLSNVDFRGAIIHRVEMINCKILGVDLSEATLQNVIFEDCNGSYAFFRFTKWKQINFKNCVLSDTDFQKANFTKVGFDHCNLEQSQMSGTKLKGIDFSNCEIEGMGVRIEDLYGAIVSPIQAISLSKLLGIVVKM
jgi:uncharacterized protein YjbI with pentapeptide repeats